MSFCKDGAVFIAGIIYEARGTYDLSKLGGFQKSHPFVAILFLVAALSLAGLPPFPGFWAKLTLVQAGLETGHYGIVAVALFVSVLTLYSMVKLWNEIFWKPAPAALSSQKTDGRRVVMLPAILLVGMILLLSVFTEPMIRVSDAAADGVLYPSPYIQAVLVAEEAQ